MTVITSWWKPQTHAFSQPLTANKNSCHPSAAPQYLHQAVNWKPYTWVPIYQWSSSREFSNKLIASDFLMSWIIKQLSTSLTATIVISLILTRNINKPWQSLYKQISVSLKKDCHQDNLSFVCLQLYKRNCLNIFVSNICYHKQVKNQ